MIVYYVDVTDDVTQTPIGCYADDVIRDMSGARYEDAQMTQSNCSKFCFNQVSIKFETFNDFYMSKSLRKRATKSGKSLY